MLLRYQNIITISITEPDQWAVFWVIISIWSVVILYLVNKSDEMIQQNVLICKRYDL